MFKLGYSIIGNYRLWITTPVFTVEHDHPKALDWPYFEVRVTRLDGLEFYVDLIKEDWLNLNLSDRNPLIKPRDKEKLTEEEKEFQTEYNSYVSNKYLMMPLTKLSRRHVVQLWEHLLLKAGRAGIMYGDWPIMDKAAVDKFLVPGAEVKLRAVFDALEPLGSLSSEKEPSWNAQAIEERIRTFLDANNIPFKETAQVVRIALTGRTQSPPLFESIAAVGKEGTLSRLQSAAAYAENNKK